MDRRGFLRGLVGALGVAAIDPMELLWKPTKTIFIPSGKFLTYHKIGISMRFIRSFDIKEHTWISRLDVVQGMPIVHFDDNPIRWAAHNP